MSRFCPILCPRFVQVLSMSNIWTNYFNFTMFCQIIVHILYKIFANCPRVDLFVPSFLYWTNFGQRNVPGMSKFCPNVCIEILEKYDKIVCLKPLSRFCPFLSKFCPIYMLTYCPKCRVFFII